MFPFGHNPYAPFQTYDPYEDLLLQQELQRRRQAEEYHRSRQLEELNRRRAEQLEYARRQAELQRRREVEARRRHEQELDARRRKLSEPAHPRPQRLRIQEPSEQEGGRESMFDTEPQDLFDMLYGNQARPSTPSLNGKRSKSSDPRGRQRINPIWSDTNEGSGTNQRPVTEDSAVSDSEEPSNGVASSQPAPNAEAAVDQSGSLETESARSHSAVSDILKSFSDLKSGFVFPNKLDFLTPPGDVTVPAPKLAYTPNNAPLHQYEYLLTGLLTKLDAVESYGQEAIRKARKDAVKQIEQELEELDVKKLQEWRRQSEAATGSAPMVVDSQLPQEPPEQVSTRQAEVDPTSVPLPRDEDQEMHLETDSLPSAPSSDSESLATPPAESSDLPPTSGNIEPHRDATPVPISVASNPPFTPGIEKSVVDDSKELKAATEGYVEVGSAGLDKGNDEVARNQVDPDDIWEVEF